MKQENPDLLTGEILKGCAPTEKVYPVSGITLRDLFAASALNALVHLNNLPRNMVVMKAFEIANAMLIAREEIIKREE